MPLALLDGAPTDAMPAVEAPEPREPDRSSLVGACQLPEKEERGKAIVAVLERWETAVRHLWPAWHEAGGMTYGDQFGSFNHTLGVWQNRTPAPAKKMTRIEIPHMEAICSDIATLQCQDPPNMRATAPTDSSAAASSAQVGDQLTWWMWEVENYDAKNVAIREAIAVYGNWYLYPRWDPTGGRLVEVTTGYRDVLGPTDPMTGLPSSMGSEPIKEKIREGCFDDALVSCFAVIPEPSSKSEFDGEGIGIHERMPISRAMQLYPEHAEFFQPTGSPAGNEGQYYESRLHNASPRTGGLNSKDDTAKRELDVWTVFVRTCAEFYRGKWIVIVGHRIAYEEDNPVYPSEEEEAKGETFPTYHWPIRHAKHKEIAGSYWGQGPAIRMIGPQKKLNAVASKKLHMLMRQAHPTLVKPKGADFRKGDDPDQEIAVARDIAPGSIYYLSYPGIPQDLQLEERLSVEQMERIAGVHSGSRGASENGDSGTKVRQLFQRDIGRLAVTKYRIDKLLGEVFSYKLRLWRRHATVARTIRIVGENHETQVRSFDMSSLAAGTDIIVFQDNALPRDPSARMLHIEKAVQLKIVDPTDPVQAASLAEVIGLAGSFRGWQSALIADRQCAKDENVRMYDGEQCVVEFWHDDLQHLAALFSEMNTGAWRKATTPEDGDPPEVMARKLQIRMLYIAHAHTHQLAIQKKTMGMAPPAGPAAGAMPPPPGGSPAGPMPSGPGPKPPMPMNAQAGPPAQGMAA